QLRIFLKTTELPRRDDDFRGRCLRELRAARAAGALSGVNADLRELARHTADLARFDAGPRLLDAEWQTHERLAESLRALGYPTRAELLRVRPIAATRPPLFALAVRYFFRREVEACPQLAFGLVLDFVQDISQAQRAGFAALDATLTEHGDRLDEGLT